MPSNQSLYVQVTQLRYSSLTQYYQYIGDRSRSKEKSLNPFHKNLNTEQLVKSKKYTGVVNAATQKRINKCVDLLLQRSKPREIFNPVTKKNQSFTINFITLTFPYETKELDQKELHQKSFLKFLRYAKNKWKITDYIWKAELTKQGILHYHITTNQFIHYQSIKDKWNDINRLNGYLKKFKKKYGHSNPNSTDVHAVKKINNIQAYLTKYLSKVDKDARTLQIKTWDASLELKKAKHYTFITTHSQDQKLKLLLQSNQIRYYENDYYRSFTFDTMKPATLLTDFQRKEYKEHLKASF